MLRFGFLQPDTIPGDVIVVLQQNEHETFKRDGANLIVERKILLSEALCGFTFHLKQLDRRTLVVKSDPSMVYAPGCVKAIMNEGMPNRNNPMLRGNLYFKFTIEFPTKLTDAQKKVFTILTLYLILYLHTDFC